PRARRVERAKSLRWLALAVLGDDHGVDAAADREVPLHPEVARREHGDQVVEDAVGDRLVEVALVAERPQVQLERLQLDALLAGDVADAEGGEVGLAGERAEAGELRALEAHLVAAPRVGVRER